MSGMGSEGIQIPPGTFGKWNGTNKCSHIVDANTFHPFSTPRTSFALSSIIRLAFETFALPFIVLLVGIILKLATYRTAWLWNVGRGLVVHVGGSKATADSAQNAHLRCFHPSYLCAQTTALGCHASLHLVRLPHQLRLLLEVDGSAAGERSVPVGHRLLREGPKSRQESHPVGLARREVRKGAQVCRPRSVGPE